MKKPTLKQLSFISEIEHYCSEFKGTTRQAAYLYIKKNFLIYKKGHAAAMKRLQNVTRSSTGDVDDVQHCHAPLYANGFQEW